ncbi:MAG: hypothetical protein MJ224_07830 [archaeon]|nr:hypothetical protein [archaeon]
MIGEEEIRRIIESLSPREIIEPALDNWTPYESTGITIINLNTGKISGISSNPNEMMETFNNAYKENHIEIYKIESNEIIYEEDLLSEEELELYEEFKEKENCLIEYTPDLFTEFCKIENINEKERKIKYLKENYEEYIYSNYQDFEHSIILNYYDEDDYTY